jgi:hypothetical protein
MNYGLKILWNDIVTTLLIIHHSSFSFFSLPSSLLITHHSSFSFSLPRPQRVTPPGLGTAAGAPSRVCGGVKALTP